MGLKFWCVPSASQQRRTQNHIPTAPVTHVQKGRESRLPPLPSYHDFLPLSTLRLSICLLTTLHDMSIPFHATHEHRPHPPHSHGLTRHDLVPRSSPDSSARSSETLRPRVRFAEEHREHIIVNHDPPTAGPRPREEVPRTPLLPVVPLPGSPALGPGQYPEDTVYQYDALSHHTPDSRSAQPTGHSLIPAHDASRTPTNSPATHTVPIAPVLPKPSPPPFTPSPESSSLSGYFQAPPRLWDVRTARAHHSWPSSILNEAAFGPNMKSGTLRFVVDRDNEWTVCVEAAAWDNFITVGDVLRAIERNLYEEVDGTVLYEGMPRYDAAIAERQYRLRGAEDTASDVLRNVDFFPQRRSTFLGLEEQEVKDENGKRTQYLVRIGASRA